MKNPVIYNMSVAEKFEVVWTSYFTYKAEYIVTIDGQETELGKFKNLREVEKYLQTEGDPDLNYSICQVYEDSPIWFILLKTSYLFVAAALVVTLFKNL
jgi:hypothetical protein